MEASSAAEPPKQHRWVKLGVTNYVTRVFFDDADLVDDFRVKVKNAISNHLGYNVFKLQIYMSEDASQAFGAGKKVVEIKEGGASDDNPWYVTWDAGEQQQQQQSGNAFEKFEELLRQAHHVRMEPRVKLYLKTHFIRTIEVINTPAEALEVFETACRVPLTATRAALLKDCNLYIDGKFIADGSLCTLFRAMDFASGHPKIVKVSRDTTRELTMYGRLTLTAEHAREHHLVHITSAVADLDEGQKKVLVMDAYASPLGIIDNAHGLPPELVLQGTRQIANALKYMHDHEVLHMDVKESNILLDTTGGWHLTDYNACQSSSQQQQQADDFEYRVTNQCIPRDWQTERVFEKVFDMTLLVGVVVRLLSADENFSASFPEQTLEDLDKIVEQVRCPALKTLLKALRSGVWEQVDATAGVTPA